MTKEEKISNILDYVAQYNRKMYQYGKDTRCYGTSHQLRADQIHLIDQIGRNLGCNLRYLSESTGTGVPTISLQVDRLKKMGLVTKHRSASNQREIEIGLTPEGETAFQFHQKLDEDYFFTAFQGLSRYNEEQLAVILDFMNSLLNKDLNI